MGVFALLLVPVCVLCFFGSVGSAALWVIGVLAAVLSLVLGIWSAAYRRRSGAVAVVTLVGTIVLLVLWVSSQVNATP